MRWFVRILIVSAFLASLLIRAPVAWSAPASHYTIVSVDALALTRLTHAMDGQAVGSRLVDGQPHAHVLYPTVIDMGTLVDGLFSQANDARTIGSELSAVGYSGTGTLSVLTHAFTWTQAGGMVDLGTTGGPELFSSATARTPTSIYGYGESADGSEVVPLRWSGDPFTLSILPKGGPKPGFVVSANSTDYASGQDQGHAVLWKPDGTRVDLHTVTGASSVGLDLNDATPPKVVGNTDSPDGARCFVATEAGGMTPLPPLAQDAISRCGALNDSGDVVGTSLTLDVLHSGPIHQGAILWDTTQTPAQALDLSTRVDNLTGWVLQEAVGISNGGIVAGRGTLNGVPTAFILIPVSEPQPAAPPAPPRHPERPGRRR